MTTLPLKDTPKFESLQALRGIAALMVLLVHQPIASQQKCYLFNEQNWLNIFWGTCVSSILHVGYVGVDLFFVLSGFIITWVSWNKFGDWKNIGEFAIKRIFRIYPIYLFMMLMYFLGDLIFYDAQAVQTFIASLFYNLTLMPLIGQLALIIGVAWSLAHEVFFYILFALCLPFARSRLKPMLYIWTVLIVLANLLASLYGSSGQIFAALAKHLATSSTTYVGLFLSTHNLFFIAGVFIAIFIKEGVLPKVLSMPIVYGAVFLLIAVAFHLIFIPYAPTDHTLWRAVFLLPPCVWVVASIVFQALNRGELQPKSPLWLQQIGDASYSLYLLHMLFIRFFRKLWIDASPEQEFYWMLVSVILSILASVGAALFTYKYIERPAIELGKVALNKLSGRT